MKSTKQNPIRAAIVTALIGTLAVATPAQLLAQEIDEIIVTARKKNESVQDIPVAVTAISSSMIESMNLENLEDISKMTAGLQFDAEFNRNSNRPVIRGQANILGSSGVAYFIDGVYISGSINDYDINDIERVEVVKGPQSALYGRNTYSGAINLITKSPGDEFSIRGGIKASDDGMTEISATVKGPITDTFAAGITARKFDHSGAFTNTFDGSDIGEQESTSISAVAEFTPTASFSARARIYVNETDDGQPALFRQSASANNCFSDNGSLYQGLGRYYCGTLAPQAVNTDWTVQEPNARDTSDTVQASLVLDYEFSDSISLASVTGFNSVESEFVIDGDYGPTSFDVANFTPSGFPFAGFPVPPFDYGYVGSIVDFTFAGAEKIEDFSQEFRLNIETEAADFMIGAYYFDQENKDSDIRELPANAAAIAGANFGAEFGRMLGVCAANPICGSIVPFFGPTIDVPRDQNNLDITNTAFFGSASFNVGESSTLRVEGRWAEEEIDQTAIIQDLAGPVVDTIISSQEFDSFTTRITFDHHFSDNAMAYVVGATGTKPGGFNSTVAIEVGLPTFDEEEVTSYEMGLKSSLADGQLIANVAVYRNELTGYQITQNARSGANTTSATVNAGNARITGVEIETVYRPSGVEGLTIMMNYAHTNAKFTDGYDENQILLNDVADDGLANDSISGGVPCIEPSDAFTCQAVGSIVGHQIPRTAEDMFFADIEMRRPLGSGDWNWYAGANYSYESSKFAQVLNLAETGDTSLVNARVGFTNDKYAVSVWAKNLTGEDSTPLVLRYADGADSFKRNFVGTARRDTYWGVTASARF